MLTEAAPDRPLLGGPTDPANRSIDVRNAALRTEIRLARGALGNAEALKRAVHDSVLYVLPLGEEGLMCSAMGGVEWVLAFSSVAEVARYALAKGADPAEEVDYLSVTGEHLVEQVLPGWGRPAGVAFDVAGAEPFLMPVLPAGTTAATLDGEAE